MMNKLRLTCIFALVFASNSSHAMEANTDYFDPNATSDYYAHVQVVEAYHLGQAITKLSERRVSAKDDLDFILRHFPNHPKALALMVEYGKQQKDPGIALPYYQKAVELNPKIASIWSDYGAYQHELKNYDDAIFCFKKAVELKPKNGLYQYNLGLALFEKKDYVGAQDAANQARDFGIPYTALQAKLDALKKPVADPSKAKAKVKAKK